MNKEDFIEKVKTSALSEAHKEEILELLKGDFTPELKEQIKDLIQMDIESDTDILTAEDKQEVETATKNMTEELDAVESDLKEDMDLVEKELNDLEAVVSVLDTVVEDSAIDKIKADIDNA